MKLLLIPFLLLMILPNYSLAQQKTEIATVLSYGGVSARSITGSVLTGGLRVSQYSQASLKLTQLTNSKTKAKVDFMEFTFMIHGRNEIANGAASIQPFYELGFSESSLTRPPDSDSDARAIDRNENQLDRDRLRGITHSIGIRLIAGGAMLLEARGKQVENVVKTSDSFVLYIVSVGISI